MDKIDNTILKNRIATADLPGVPMDITFRPACVFLLLFDTNQPHLVFIQKADTEGYPWRNQMALPGGHIDPGDASPVETAFRELEEELQIKRDQVELIGSMGHFQTINSRDIEVFMGIWNGRGPIRYDKAEISRVLEIPVNKLISIHNARGFRDRRPNLLELKYPVGDVVIWGVTAKILHFFIEQIVLVSHDERN
jgi:peroxisomal coenzyme A diphosphatase NUDT7